MQSICTCAQLHCTVLCFNFCKVQTLKTSITHDVYQKDMNLVFVSKPLLQRFNIQVGFCRSKLLTSESLKTFQK